MSRKNLEEYGQSCVYEAAYDMVGKPLDMDSLEEEARERVWTDAEHACIYHSDCLDIISEYDSEFGSDADDMGQTFKASEWQEAMNAYAFGVARNAIGSYCEDVLTNMRDLVDVIEAEASERGADTSNRPVVTHDCSHGWAPHDLETAEGVYYWAPPNLEGCHAVAVKTDSGLWLSYTWTAEAGETQAEES